MNQNKSIEKDGNYRIRPDANNEFKVAEVKSIITDIMQQVLDGKKPNIKLTTLKAYFCFCL